MPEPRRILTVHSPVPPKVLDTLLTAVESALHRAGADRVWIDADWGPDLTVMAEMSETPAVPEPASAVARAVPAY